MTNQMKAYVLHGVGDLRYEETALPELPAGWALVKVSAAGICSSDIPRIFETGTYKFPTIPGHEFCGRVTAVASAHHAELVGRYMGVFPLIPCKQCASCLVGDYQLCKNYDYLGSRRNGGFAEYVAVPVWNLVHLPESVPPEHGALLEVAAVSLHAVKRAGFARGSSVCVIGSGAIGFLIAQWAKLYAAESVCVLGRSASKAVIAGAVGVEYCQANEPVYDVVFEAVGSNDSLARAIRLLRPRGMLVLMGNPVKFMHLEKSLYWDILRKELTLKGSWNSQYENERNSEWAEATAAIAQKRLMISPIITHVLPQEKLGDGLNVMLNKLEMYCKIVVRFQG